MNSPLPRSKFPRLVAFVALVGACLAPATLHAVVTLNPSGTADRTSAINTAINNARAAGDYVMLNAGTYYHDGEITISGAVEVRGAGDSTILVSRTPLSAPVRLTGTGPKLRNIRVQSNFTGPFVANSTLRSQADLSTRVYIKEAIAFLVENVTAEYSRGSGMIVTNSRGTSSSAKAKILNCRARNTLADGIHITNGSKWVHVEGCNNTNTGDDLIAIVSKLVQPNVCTDIAIIGNTVTNGLWGRGITVVGGTNIVIRNNTITAPSGSGILLASDSYDTYQVSNVEVKNNTITDANNHQRGGQNGITLEGRLRAADGLIYRVSNINLIDNRINNAKGRGVMVGRYTENITLTDMKIDGTAASGVEISAPKPDAQTPPPAASVPKNITITGASTSSSYIKNTNNQGVSASYVTGFVKVQNTRFEQINKSGTSNTDVVRVAQNNNLTATITGNHYANPSAAGGIRNYIRCEETTYTTINPVNTRASGIATTSSPTAFSP